MASSQLDYFQKVGDATVTTLAAPGKALGATSITVGSTTNYPTDTGVTIAIRVVDSAGELVTGTYTEYVGTITSGTSAAINGTPVYGSDQVYAAGSTTQVYIGLSKYAHNRLVDGLLVAHDQDGTLKAGAVDVAAVLASDVVTTAKILDSNVTSAKVAAGFVVQVATTNYSSVATGTTVIPNDDTIPQITEGTEFMSIAFTPKSATNILAIDAIFFGANSGSDFTVVALFQDAVANAIAADGSYSLNINQYGLIPISASQVAGTTSAITFRLRAGPTGANTVTFNGSQTARKFGAIPHSFIRVTEYKA